MKNLIANRCVLIGAMLGAAVTLAIGYGSAVAQNGGAGGGGGKTAVVATVNLSAVMEKLDQRAEAEANLTALVQKIRNEEKTRKDELQKMQDQLEQMIKAAAGDAAARNEMEEPTAEMAELQEQLAQRTLQLQAWSRFSLDKADIEKALLMQDLYRSVKMAAQQMAMTNGYDLVLVDDSQGDLSTSGDSRVSRESQVVQQIAGRRMLYVNPALDITDAIITRMNNAHKAGGGAAGAPPAAGAGANKPQG